MARRNMSCVPVTLAIATACVKLGQVPRARNQLKRIHVRPSRSSWLHSLCPGPVERFYGACVLVRT